MSVVHRGGSSSFGGGRRGRTLSSFIIAPSSPARWDRRGRERGLPRTMRDRPASSGPGREAARGWRRRRPCTGRTPPPRSTNPRPSTSEVTLTFVRRRLSLLLSVWFWLERRCWSWRSSTAPRASDAAMAAGDDDDGGALDRREMSPLARRAAATRRRIEAARAAAAATPPPRAKKKRTTPTRSKRPHLVPATPKKTTN